MEENKSFHKSGKKKTLLIVLILTAIVIVVGAVMAVQSGRPPDPTEEDPVSAPETESQETETPTTETTVTESMEESVSAEETIPEETYTGYELKTPIGTVYYPEEWMDFIEVEEKTEGDTFISDFCCKAADEAVCLFTLSVGPEGKGYLLGTLEDQSVWIDVCQIETQDTWSEEDTSRIFDMQNRVNDILDQIYHLDGFQKSVQ